MALGTRELSERGLRDSQSLSTRGSWCSALLQTVEPNSCGAAELLLLLLPLPLPLPRPLPLPLPLLLLLLLLSRVAFFFLGFFRRFPYKKCLASRGQTAFT